MKTIKVLVCKNKQPLYSKPEEVEDSFRNCHLLINNLTIQQKNKILELIGTFGDVVTKILEK